MSASTIPAPGAAAFQIAATLERYEEQVRTLLTRGPDLELHRAVGGSIERIRCLCVALPQLAVPWLALLLSHTQVMQRLARSPVRAAALHEALAEHAACIEALARKCRRLLDRRGD